MDMKNAVAVLIVTVLALCALALAVPGESQPHPSQASKNAQPVIVELFTSEGCSSCPPADALLLKLESSQPVPGANIIAIEEHVDYWNHDGWTDPFSSADWTYRQTDYVARFKDKDAFTPQMIVDGQTQMGGGQLPQVGQAILQAATLPKTQVTLTAEDSAPHGDQQFKVHVGNLVGSADRDTAEVWLAITESGLESAVGAGENAGKDLRHASVLRSLHKIGVASAKGESAFEASTRVKLKSEWKRKNIQVVVFIQEKKSMRILGAASVGVAS
jgi:hypothetical protein